MITMDHDWSSRLYQWLMWMANHKSEFHLTGSRFFGNHKVWSDYDFFTQYTEEMEKELKSNGFETLDPVLWNNSKYHEDPNIALVLQAKDCHPHLQIQLVMSFDLKMKAQALLKSIPIEARKTFLMASQEKMARPYWEWAFGVVTGKVVGGAIVCEYPGKEK